jgi:dTDP-4-dehydrorhamnose reductase
MLARDLAAQAPVDVELESMSHSQLDITDQSSVESALDASRPEVVINASGYTAVDAAEADRARAFAINATAVGQLGGLCARRQIRVVHFSTDYVFDGEASTPYREDDVPAPINCYGESKLAGERALLSSGAAAFVIRAQWLFGENGASFPRSMWERARRGEPTRVVRDQRGRPTFTHDLARASWRLIELGKEGVFHVAASGEATWYDVAARVFSRCGASDLVTSCRTADFPRPARRPRYTVLDTTRSVSELGSPLPSWEAALDQFLQRLDAGHS